MLVVDVVVLVVVVVSRVVEVVDVLVVVDVVVEEEVVVVIVAPLRSAVSRATKACRVPPPKALWAPPLVPGKLVDSVKPVTYTSPVVGAIARAKASSSKTLPPR